MNETKLNLRLGQPTVIKSVSISELINDYLKRHPEINFSKLVTNLVESHIGKTENAAEPIVILTQIEALENRIAKLKENTKYKRAKYRVKWSKELGYVPEEDKEFYKTHPDPNAGYDYCRSEERKHDVETVKIYENKFAELEKKMAKLKASLSSSSSQRKK